MATTWLVATGLFLLVSLPGLQCGTPPSSFAVQFDVDGSGNAIYGDTRIDFTGRRHEVTFKKPFKFGKSQFSKFYIAPNGGISTVQSASPHFRIKFLGKSSYTINAFLAPVADECPSKTDCGVYFRFGDKIDKATKTSISRLVNNYHLDSLNYGDQIKDFIPDTDLTLVVTWYRLKAYKPEIQPRNSFQAVITSDGKASYAIFSYKELNYPYDGSPYQVGIDFTQDVSYCASPIHDRGNSDNHPSYGKERLYCQSNVFKRGSHLYELTTEDSCGPKKILEVNCKNKDCASGAKNYICDGVPLGKSCGKDGKTYPSICELKKAACNNFDVENHNVTLDHFGKCYESPCKNENNGCEGTCMDVNKDVSCKCLDGKKLKNDGKSCDWSGYMYFADKNGFRISKGAASKHFNASKVDAIVHDYRTNTIFFATERQNNGKKEFNIEWTSFSSISNFSSINTFPAGGKVTHMMFRSSDSSIFYALENGQVKQISNIYMSPKVSDIHKFSGVVGMVGGSCEGNGFVLDKSGEIYHLNQNKVIVKDIKHPSGLAIDAEKHKLYWSSASGVVESNYDGFCRRNVSTVMKDRRNLYFHDGSLHFLHENSLNQTSLMKMDIYTGEENNAKNFHNYVSTFGVISNDERWAKAKVMQKRVNRLNKEFKVELKFSATAPRKTIFKLVDSMTNDIVSVNSMSNSMVEFVFGERNMSIDVKSGMNEIEFGQMRKGEDYFRYVRINGKHMSTFNNSNAKDLKNVDISGSSNDFTIFYKNSFPNCKVKSICSTQCGLNNGGCEDQCMSTKDGTVCKCTDDKLLKSDGKSCHWKEYFLFGSENHLYLSNGFVTKDVPVVGNVTATSTDYSTNTLFYATVSMNNGKEEFSINSFQPKENYKVLFTNISARVTAMLYSGSEMRLYYSLSNGYAYQLSNIYGEVTNSLVVDYDFGSIADIDGEECTGKMFVLDSENGSIWAFNNETDFPTKATLIDGLKNPKALAVDHVNKTLFWYSDAGIEMSSFDGGCRRVIAKNSSLMGSPSKMVFADALYWTNSEKIDGNYHVMRTDVHNGVTTFFSYSRQTTPFTDIDFLYPSQRWTERKNVKVNQVNNDQQLKKEFRVTFDFMSPDPRNAIFMPSVNNTEVDAMPNGLTIFFLANMTRNNFTIPFDIRRTHFIEISQEKLGSSHHFRIKRDNTIMFSGINNNPTNVDGSFRSRNVSSAANFRNIRVYTKTSYVNCQQMPSCSIRDCSSCEDDCIKRQDIYPPVKKCACKKLKPDMKTCDWTGERYYVYYDDDENISKFHGPNGVVTSFNGNVTEIDHDSDTNEFYVAYNNQSGSYIIKIMYRERKAHLTIALEWNETISSVAVGKGEVHFSSGFKHYRIINGTATVLRTDASEIIQIYYDVATRKFTSSFDRFFITDPNRLRKYQWLKPSQAVNEMNIFDRQCFERIAPVGSLAAKKPYSMERYDDMLRLNYLASYRTINLTSRELSSEYPSNTSKLIRRVAYDKEATYRVVQEKGSLDCHPCKNKNGGCSGVCKTNYHVKGKDVACSCEIGALASDGTSCTLDNRTIYGMSDGFSITSMSKSSMHSSTDSGNVLGVEFDYHKDTIFYSQHNVIYEFKWKENKTHTFVNVSKEYGPIEHLAFDWNKKVMYFTTKNYLHMSSGNHSTNVSYFGRTSGVAFEPCSGKVFVTCNTSNTLYEWTNEHGTKKVLTGLNNPQALAIDYHEHQLYFFETDRITQTNFDGSCKNTIAEGLTGSRPYEIQVFGVVNYMFWTDLNMKSGYNIMNTTFDGKTKSIYKDNMQRFGHKSYWNRKSAEYTCQMKNLGKCVYGACKYNNGGCEDKCISQKDLSSKCQCTNGFLKTNDYKTCDYGDFIVSGVGYHVRLGNKFNVTSDSEIRGVDFDYRKNQIYFSTKDNLEKGKKSEIRMFGGKGIVKTLFTSDFEVCNVYYDAAMNQVYYLTQYYLRRFDLNTKISTKLAYFPKAKGLAFDPCQRKAFVACSTGVMVWEEGKLPVRLPFMFGHMAESITIDVVNHKLYVFDRRSGITQANYDGSCQTYVSKYISDTKPYGMVYIPDGDYIMWSDVKQSGHMYSVMKTSVKDGQTSVMRSGRQATYGMKRIFDRKFEGSCPPRHTCNSGVCKNGGGCEQLCSIMNNGSRKCHCRYGGVLRKDGRTCDYSKVVYTASGRYLMFRHGNNMNEATIFHMADGMISAIAHNPKDTGIYYAVKHKNGGSTIFFKPIHQKKRVMIASKPYYAINSMAYDQEKDVLYYSLSNGKIQRMYNPLRANRRDENIITAGEPAELTLSYCRRHLYYFDNIHKLGRVMRISEGDKMPEVMGYGYGVFSGLTIDRERNMLYWKNANDSFIRESTSGHCQRGIVQANNVKFMVAHDRKVFYSDGKKNIMMVNTVTNGKHSLKSIPYPITGGMKVFYYAEKMANNTGRGNDMASTTPRPMSTTARSAAASASRSASPASSASPSTSPSATQKPRYEKGYTMGADGHWYKFHQNATTFAVAKAVCESESAHLMIIDSQATFNYVTKMMKKERYTNWIWIGGEDKFSTNTWKWVNGIDVDNKYWNRGEPNNFNDIKENCMAVHPMTGARFYDALCSSTQPNFICQKGGYYKGPNDGYRYKIHRTSADWHQAKAVCESEGAHLAVVESQKTFDYIAHIAKKSAKYMWIGGYDKFSNNTWKWANGNMVGKKYWLTGEPNNYNGVREDCMAMYPIGYGGFVDAYCLWKEPTFVCQKKDIIATQKMDDGFRQGNDGNFYRYFTTPKTWMEAKAHCEQQKSVLAVARSIETRMYMKQMFPNNYWIGLSDSKEENKWEWIDGKAMTAGNWYDTANFGDKYDCAHMIEGGVWDRSFCTVKRPYLCQRAGVQQKCGARRQCPHQKFYPYGKQFGDNTLPRGDDTSAHLKFNKGIPFFSKRRTDIFIHTNGHLTADKNDGNWTHSAKSDTPVLAVYMMDLTTEFGGDVFYRVTTDKSILDRIAFETSLTYTFSKGYRPTMALIVTWHDVSVKSHSSKKLTFQIVYHTDNYVAGSNTIYNHLSAAGGMTGYNEGKCNSVFNTEASRETSMNMAYSTNIGINGIYVANLFKAGCSIAKTPKEYFVNVKYQTSKPSSETSMKFFFNGANKITNVFTQTYSWIYESISFVTTTVHKLDEVHVNYVYYVNSPYAYNWGVSVLAVRDNINKTLVRNGHVDFKRTHHGSFCYHVDFETSLMKSPFMLLDVHANYTNALDGLSSAWLTNVSSDGFNVCYKPMVDFWAPRSISVDYLATTHKDAVGATEMGAIDFDVKEQKINEVFCKPINFELFYHQAPSVFVTPEDVTSETSEVGDLMTWVKDSKRAHAVVCVRKLKETNTTVRVHYFVYQVLDKCSSHKCPAHLECHLDKSGSPTCGCKKNCADYYQETFCGSDLRTYKSRCEMEKHYCDMKQNDKIASVHKLYDGMCKQYPYQTGKAQLTQVAGLKSAYCESVTLDENRFYKGKDMKVLLTVFWKNGTIKTHDASASWSEDVTTKGFKACVMVAGRHFFDSYDTPSVQWVAYQDGVATASPDLEVGTVNMKTWYTGSRCHFINLMKHTPQTKVLVSVEHGVPRIFTNAMTAWVEKTSNGRIMKVCARELQNFDGIHKDIKIHYMALHNPVTPYIVEPHEIHFERQSFTKDQVIPPVCKTVMYNMNYPKLPNPTVILTAVNVSNLHSNSVFSLHDITAWIEENDDKEMTVCFKSIRAGLFREEIKVQYAIFPSLCEKGWRYFNGHCYQFNSSDTDKDYSSADEFCKAGKASLPESKMDAPTTYFFKRTYGKSSPLWMQKNKENMCLFAVGQNASQFEYNSTKCSDNTTSAFVCQKNPNHLTKACHCENGGKCIENEYGHVHCECPKPFVGKRCEKEVHMNCIEHTNMTHTMENNMKVGIWYRYPGKQMVEFCPKRKGCASLDQAHPKVSDKESSRGLIYGNYMHYNNGECTKDYGKVHVQNCGNFYVYKLVSIKRRDLGSALCFEDYVRQM